MDDAIKEKQFLDSIIETKELIRENMLMEHFGGNNKNDLSIKIEEAQKQNEKNILLKNELIDVINQIKNTDNWLNNSELVEKNKEYTKKLLETNILISKMDKSLAIPIKVNNRDYDQYELNIKKNINTIENNLEYFKSLGFNNLDNNYPSVSIGNIEEQCNSKGIKYWLNNKTIEKLPIINDKRFSISSNEMEKILLAYSNKHDGKIIDINNIKNAGPIYRVFHKKEINSIINMMYGNNISKDFKKKYIKDYASLLKAGVTLDELENVKIENNSKDTNIIDSLKVNDNSGNKNIDCKEFNKIMEEDNER